MDPGLSDSRDSLMYQRVPWGRSAQALGISMGAKSLILAALGLVLMQAGWWALEQVFPKPFARSVSVTPQVTTGERPDLESWPFHLLPPETPPGVVRSRESVLLSGSTLLASFEALRSALARVATPAEAVMTPFLAVFQLRSTARETLHAALAAVWGVLVWGFFGGAIARIAVVRASRGERVGLKSALGFALRKLPPLVGTPLCPFIAVAVFLVPCALLGLLYQDSGPAGPALAGVLMVFPLLAGLIMALILVGLGACWPLMVATVAAEGEDSFDALSRSYSYVYQRPGRYALSVGLAWLLGVVGLVVVSVFAALTVHLATWGLALGAPDVRLWSLLANQSPQGGGFPASAHRFWLSVVEVLARGWVYSYFWTASAFIYLRMRLDVDGTPWNVVQQTTPSPLEPSATNPAPAVANAEPGEAGGQAGT